MCNVYYRAGHSKEPCRGTKSAIKLQSLRFNRSSPFTVSAAAFVGFIVAPPRCTGGDDGDDMGSWLSFNEIDLMLMNWELFKLIGFSLCVRAFASIIPTKAHHPPPLGASWRTEDGAHVMSVVNACTERDNCAARSKCRVRDGCEFCSSGWWSLREMMIMVYGCSASTKTIVSCRSPPPGSLESSSLV